MLFRTIIVKNQRQKAKDLFSFALGEAGENMFDTELSDGSFISSGNIHKSLIEHLPLDGEIEGTFGRISEGNVEAVQALITENEKEMTLTDIQSVFDDMEITDEDPFVAMFRREAEMKVDSISI